MCPRCSASSRATDSGSRSNPCRCRWVFAYATTSGRALWIAARCSVTQPQASLMTGSSTWRDRPAPSATTGFRNVSTSWRARDASRCRIVPATSQIDDFAAGSAMPKLLDVFRLPGRFGGPRTVALARSSTRECGDRPGRRNQPGRSALAAAQAPARLRRQVARGGHPASEPPRRTPASRATVAPAACGHQSGACSEPTTCRCCTRDGAGDWIRPLAAMETRCA